MPIQAGEGKNAVALFVDGLELKYVRLSAKGKRITLRDYRTVVLGKKLEEKHGMSGAPEEPMLGEFSSSESFGGGMPGDVHPEEGSNNASVLLGVISEIGNPKQYSLSYSLVEPAITYQEFESNFGLTGEKLKKRLVDELTASRSMPPASDSIDTITTASGGLLALIREDGMPLYDLLMEVKSFVGGKIPNLNVINTSDTALMEVVRTQYTVQDEEITVLVYVGHDFSRIIFMQGREYLHFAPIISEGYESPNIENTLYSRVLLEQDNIALTRIDRILLCGEAHKINLLEAMAPQFSSAEVEYIKAPLLDLGEFEATIGDTISEYAIPIMTAWGVADSKTDGLYGVNIISRYIIESQRNLALAWHGVLIAAMVSLSIAFFILQIPARMNTIKHAKEELAVQQQKLHELDVFRAKRDQLNSDITRYNNAITVYDNVAPGSDRWSRILHYLANSVEDLNGIWINSIQPDPSNSRGILITGRTLFRGRIPRIASIFEKATLKEVRLVEIRKKTLYEFDIVVEQVDKNDVAEVNSGK